MRAAPFIIPLTIVLLIPFPGICLAKTIHVPGDQPTIQAGIDAAVNGDVVLVAPGSYKENLDFLGKAITVMSSHGSAETVIDGGNPSDPDIASVVRFHSGEGSDSVLCGFTLTNGMGTDTGLGWTTGGAVACYQNASPTITGNVIEGNTALEGGGIWCYGCSPTITHNKIMRNSCGDGGGGIAVYYSSAEILGNTISENTAWRAGGIYCVKNSSPVITGNVIALNQVDLGGGIYCQDYCYPVISNNIIHGNTAAVKAGGIWCDTSSPVITNNTICWNASNEGGGIWCQTSASHPVVTNTILWSNSATTGSEIWIGYNISPAELTISHSDVKGGPSSVYVAPNCTLNWGSGMIDADPLFVDEAIGDLHLTALSPCRDAGDIAAVVDPADFEGDPRIADGSVDMGADEFHTHLYHTGNAVPGGTVEMKFVDLPGTAPVAFWIAFNALDTPVPGAYGNWYLLPPMVGPFTLPPIPSGGVYILPGTLPASPPGPYDLHLQAIMGSPLKLTNLCTVSVQ